jgi:hypothetical protein
LLHGKEKKKMSVTIRKRKSGDGSQALYLDVYSVRKKTSRISTPKACKK